MHVKVDSKGKRDSARRTVILGSSMPYLTDISREGSAMMGKSMVMLFSQCATTSRSHASCDSTASQDSVASFTPCAQQCSFR